jgi:ethanolamine utilization microcompartment shell protein EutS
MYVQGGTALMSTQIANPIQNLQRKLGIDLDDCGGDKKLVHSEPG